MGFKYKVQTMLDEQYRMNEAIMKWSSDAMYEGNLKAHEDVKNHTMGDLYQGSEDDLLNSPLVVIDTAGALMFEQIDE